MKFVSLAVKLHSSGDKPDLQSVLDKIDLSNVERHSFQEAFPDETDDALIGLFALTLEFTRSFDAEKEARKLILALEKLPQIEYIHIIPTR